MSKPNFFQVRQATFELRDKQTQHHTDFLSKPHLKKPSPWLPKSSLARLHKRQSLPRLLPPRKHSPNPPNGHLLQRRTRANQVSFRCTKTRPDCRIYPVPVAQQPPNEPESNIAIKEVNGKTHHEPEPKTTKRKRVVDEDEDDASRRTKTTKTEAITERKQAKPVAKKPAKKEKPAVKEPVSINQAPTERIAVYSFGSGECGELGLGPKRTAALVPKFNPALDPNEASKHHIVQLACGGMHTIALTADNKILTWGVNDEGALGRDTTWEGGLKDMDGGSGSDSEEEDGELNPHECSPTEVPAKHFPKGTVFTQVTAGDSCSFVLTESGNVYGWGSFRVSCKSDKDHPRTFNLLTFVLRTTRETDDSQKAKTAKS